MHLSWEEGVHPLLELFYTSSVIGRLMNLYRRTTNVSGSISLSRWSLKVASALRVSKSFWRSFRIYRPDETTGTFKTLSNILDGAFGENNKWLLAVYCFRKTLHLRYLTVFCISLWKVIDKTREAFISKVADFISSWNMHQ